MITPGTPEKPNPATLNGHSGVTTAHRRPTWCQTLGSEAPRCGSLARSGLPLSVIEPDTTQEFEPTPSPTPPRRELTASMTPSTFVHSIEAVASVLSGAPESASVPVSRLAGSAVVMVGTMTG